MQLFRYALLGSALLAAAPLEAQVDYARADMIRIAQTRIMNVPDFVDGFGFAVPTWLEDSTRFWYRIRGANGNEFILADPLKGVRRPAFDHARIASSLSVAADTAVDPAKLPFRTFTFVESDRAIEVKVGKRYFTCDLDGYRCVKGDTVPSGPPAWAVLSPDKQWEAFSHKYNIYIRPASGAKRDSIQLTTDGVAGFGYGLGSLEAPVPDTTAPRRPEVVWSPDSRRLAVPRIDDRGVRRYPVYSSTSIHPKLFLYPTATPGDSIVAVRDIHILTIEGRGNVKIETAPMPDRILGWSDAARMQWTPGSDRLFFVSAARANKVARLHSADAATGKAQEIARDSSATYVENASGIFTGNWRILGRGGEALWWSERDGWGHLYRYDAAGRVINQVTSGAWLVDRVKYVDSAGRQVYFQAAGRDPAQPYFTRLVRVGVDGSGWTELTPEPGNHAVIFAPGGRYFIDIHATPDSAPVTRVRSPLDGRVLMTLERGDVSQLRGLGWTPPVPFKVKARDGVTDLYGLMYLPSRLDSTRKYPILNNVYPGPQVGSIFQWGFNPGGEQRALAELGFVVIQVNALGTNGRSKAFHDFYYGNMGDNGIPDQIAAMQQLAARYRFIDIERTGIYGLSGGGFASTDAILRYPDFFKVAVSQAGNHDNRSYFTFWGEKYTGLLKKDSATGKDNFESQANYLLAGNLKGHLLLMTGDMDTNVHPAMTFRMVDALIKAGKDFDLMVLPDLDHANSEYSTKKRWDYFVRWLGLGEPPRNYQMMKETP
jgi:dipeptidyl aminopeptidase/acylaminoacyl peptidase